MVWCVALCVGTAAGDNGHNDYFAALAGGGGVSLLVLRDIAVFAHSSLLCLLLLSSTISHCLLHLPNPYTTSFLIC